MITYAIKGWSPNKVINLLTNWRINLQQLLNEALVCSVQQIVDHDSSLKV
jgi:hypothetical protein